MDYEKKYNEALEKARKAYNSISPENYGARRIIEDAFPELRESKDERIRKAIESVIRVYGKTQGNWIAGYDMDTLVVHLRDAFAYLEKQKDASKAIEAVDRIDKYIDEHLANAHDMKDSNPDKKYYRGWDDALGKMAGILQDVYSEKENKFAPRVLPCSAAWFEDGEEKQKEQKPSEWSEEEALNRTYEEGFNDGLKYRKPVKRSDEDKKMSDWLIGLVNANTELSFKDKVNLTRWLEHLTIEKELSKNDKRIIDAIIIGYQDKDFRSSQIPTPIGVSKDEVIAWLKSLRPQTHWKPTKNMLEALKWAKCEFHPDCPETMEQLQYLYTELKKIYYDGD